MKSRITTKVWNPPPAFTRDAIAYIPSERLTNYLNWQELLRWVGNFDGTGAAFLANGTPPKPVKTLYDHRTMLTHVYWSDGTDEDIDLHDFWKDRLHR